MLNWTYTCWCPLRLKSQLRFEILFLKRLQSQKLGEMQWLQQGAKELILRWEMRAQMPESQRCPRKLRIDLDSVCLSAPLCFTLIWKETRPIVLWATCFQNWAQYTSRIYAGEAKAVSFKKCRLKGRAPVWPGPKRNAQTELGIEIVARQKSANKCCQVPQRWYLWQQMPWWEGQARNQMPRWHMEIWLSGRDFGRKSFREIWTALLLQNHACMYKSDDGSFCWNQHSTFWPAKLHEESKWAATQERLRAPDEILRLRSSDVTWTLHQGASRCLRGYNCRHLKKM